MSDRATLAKARRELEDLYLGVPDDSVNLTFQDFAQVSQHASSTAAAGKSKKQNPPPPPPAKKMDSISEFMSTPKHDNHYPPQHLSKAPSLDFSKALEASATAPPHHHLAAPPVSGYKHHRVEEVVQHGGYYGGGSHGHHHVMKSPHGHGHGHHVVEKNHNNNNNNSMAYDDMSMMSGMSMTSMYQEKTGRRRPGVPHSNICTVCSVYIYMFRNRCLVCGRVYCRQCMNIGMGEMTEGRKCLDCLGRKFSQRYIHRAGDVGCFSSCLNGYPSNVKMQELKWAEKGPRRSGQSMYNKSAMMSNPMSTQRSPLGTPRTPNRHFTSSPPSFVTTPEYSPYATPSRHHLPF